MKDFIKNIDEYIAAYDEEKILFEKGKSIKKRGHLLKDEFLQICLWKSRRPKNWYKENTSEAIKETSKEALTLTDENRKISLLCELQGVSIATASALLSVIDPDNYPIIDARCTQALKDLGYIKWENINYNNWLEYLAIIRKIAKENNLSAREVEKGLFAYNRIDLDKKYINLYRKAIEISI